MTDETAHAKERAVFPFPAAIAWAAAACFAIAAAWLGVRYLNARSANLLLRDQQALTDLELRSARNQLEAERIINRQQLADLNQKLKAETASRSMRSRNLP